MMDKFVCGICGKEYSNVGDRAACETMCLKKLEEERKKIEAAKMREEKAARTTRLNNLCDQFMKEYGEYVRDYGSYTYSGESHVTWPNLKSLFHFFM